MKLFHRYQSRAFQSALTILALLERQNSLSRADLDRIARKFGLDYGDQIVAPLVRAGILEQSGSVCRRGEDWPLFHLAPGKLEQDYLQYILTLPEAELFLNPTDREKLAQSGGDRSALEAVQRFLPQGEPLPAHPGRTGVQAILRAIREGRLIRYQFRTREVETYQESTMRPWRLEYSAYDRRWWAILYHPQEKRTIKARLDNLRDIQLLGPSDISGEEIQRAMDRLLEPEPAVLQVRPTKGALERCFLVFEHQMFLETRQLSPEVFRLSFQFYRFDRGEILRRLLYLGPAVELLGPESLRQDLLKLVDQALAEQDSYSF